MPIDITSSRGDNVRKTEALGDLPSHLYIIRISCNNVNNVKIGARANAKNAIRYFFCAMMKHLGFSCSEPFCRSKEKEANALICVMRRVENAWSDQTGITDGDGMNCGFMIYHLL